MQFQEKTRSAKERKWRIHEGRGERRRGGGKQGNTRNTENGVKDEVLERKERWRRRIKILTRFIPSSKVFSFDSSGERKEISFSCQEIKNEIEPTSTSSLFSWLWFLLSCCIKSSCVSLPPDCNQGQWWKETTCVCLLIFCLLSSTAVIDYITPWLSFSWSKEFPSDHFHSVIHFIHSFTSCLTLPLNSFVSSFLFSLSLKNFPNVFYISSRFSLFPHDDKWCFQCIHDWNTH